MGSAVTGCSKRIGKEKGDAIALIRFVAVNLDAIKRERKFGIIFGGG